MKIIVNGELREIEADIPILQLVQSLGYDQNSVAVACDGQFVPRHLWSTKLVEPTANVEVLSPMQGG